MVWSSGWQSCVSETYTGWVWNSAVVKCQDSAASQGQACDGVHRFLAWEEASCYAQSEKWLNFVPDRRHGLSHLHKALLSAEGCMDLAECSSHIGLCWLAAWRKDSWVRMIGGKSSESVTPIAVGAMKVTVATQGTWPTTGETLVENSTSCG